MRTMEITAANGTKFRVEHYGPGERTKGGGDMSKPAVGFFDLGYPAKFGPEGQYVASYLIESIADVTGGMALNMGVPAWRVDAESMAVILAWVKQPSQRINMTRIGVLLEEQGVPVLIDSTGGGVMCAFIGEPDRDGFYPASVGPGTVEADGVFGMAGDFYAGRDENGPDHGMSRHFEDGASEEDVVAYVLELLDLSEVHVSLTLNAGTITAYWTGRDEHFTQRVFSDYTLDEIRGSLREEIGGPVSFAEPTRSNR